MNTIKGYEGHFTQVMGNGNHCFLLVAALDHLSHKQCARRIHIIVVNEKVAYLNTFEIHLKLFFSLNNRCFTPLKEYNIASTKPLIWNANLHQTSSTSKRSNTLPLLGGSQQHLSSMLGRTFCAESQWPSSAVSMLAPH